MPGGPFTMGTSTEPWALDNERPAHQVARRPRSGIDTAPVTNADYPAFIDAGGYDDPRWWSGRAGPTARTPVTAPRFWTRVDGAGGTAGSARLEPLPPRRAGAARLLLRGRRPTPRWAGKRLPTEAEWEKAARHDPATGRSDATRGATRTPTPQHANLGQRHLGPAEVGAYPAGASPLGVQQLIGDVWEWTSSDFHPYPGFAAVPVREYSLVFFGADYKVLRGGSFGTDAVACRGTFRNWDYPIRRQIFAGFRCARDAAPRSSAEACAATWPTSAPPCLAELVPDPPHSLVRQSWAPRDMRRGGTVNADGFGIGWYPPGEPGARPAATARSMPMWTDASLPTSPA